VGRPFVGRGLKGVTAVAGADDGLERREPWKPADGNTARRGRTCCGAGKPAPQQAVRYRPIAGVGGTERRFLTGCGFGCRPSLGVPPPREAGHRGTFSSRPWTGPAEGTRRSAATRYVGISRR